jgi:cob(I)alamin adenosyltransferase
MVYLNRLSDLLFVFARVANGGGKGDVLWVPGRNTKASDKADDAG